MLHEQINNWNNELSAITADYIAAFGKLDNKALNTKPNADTWSIAQVIEHVIKTNESYFPGIEGLHNGTYTVPFLGRISFLNNFFGNFILKSVQPEAKRRIKTFPKWEPSSSDISSNILERFERSQQQLQRAITGSEKLLEKQSRISSPVNVNIVYKLDKLYDILVAHEKRHLKQAKEILETISK